MFKAIEIHSGYLSSALAFILHLLAAFYLLYILKITHDAGFSGSPEKRVIWYQAPTINKTAQLDYQEPKLNEPVSAQAQEVATVPALESTPAQEIPATPPTPLRKGRSSAERRAAWTKPTTQEPSEDKKLTAGTFMEAISQEQAQRRQAQAVYSKQEAIKQGIAAQMRELTEGRLRHKVFSAMQMAFDQYPKKFYSPVPIMSAIDLSIVIDPKGKVVAVEVLRSSGVPELDAFLADIIQSIKGIALPASYGNGQMHTLTFPAKVTLHAGTGQIIFDYKDASGMHIV